MGFSLGAILMCCKTTQIDFSFVLPAVPDHAAKLQRLSQIHIQQQVL